ncbi:hypothetical protein UA75_09475 [Actinoalloteichus sp. GBA129-24]|uniref:Uncharacterized protein n=1 Tax=Actinoalloteichus fjordicus TaxID=1612552 RepID=A0AAC9LCT9_9PSEU|nr:hypothetical protein UA74_09505 [Actinoalloteichus fjordicus]APU19910.1 hypothetical protein UA75_09475 [Actinoalloteichus sp. GBA129-24]
MARRLISGSGPSAELGAAPVTLGNVQPPQITPEAVWFVWRMVPPTTV